MEKYDEIGNNYNTTRKADHRITNILIKLLNLEANSLIADIGAGTGNYSFELAREGYIVHAVEPSKKMISQRKKHANLHWIEGKAEKIPLKSNIYDGAVCTLASHHFQSLKKSFREIARILKPNGVFALFTGDPRKVSKHCWIKTYFNTIYNQACKTLPELGTLTSIIEKTFNNQAETIPFKLPSDLADGFFYSGWQYPERYLDKNFRNGISVFALYSPKKILSLVNQLEKDIQNGSWDANYGHIRNLDKYNGGYYFIRIQK